METNQSYPLLLKIANIFIALLALFYVLYIGQSIILPLVYAAIFAILLNPMVNWLSARKVNRVVGITIVLILTILVSIGVIYYISSQLIVFGETFPQFKEKFGLLTKEFFRWVSQTFGVRTTKINEWIEQVKSQGYDNSTLVIGQTLSTLTSMFAIVFLVPVYIFMMLFYKPLLLDFMGQLFSRDKHGTVVEVLNATKSLIQSYLVGLILEVIIVAVMNVTALLMLGVEYAVLLGIIGALLNMIPYIGGLVAIAMPVLVALATQSPATAGLVIVAYSVIQLIDNNVIMPKVVASKVKINALVSIIVVLIGGALWGIPGMFLSIPLTAIIKVIFDRIEPLQPWGFLLGDTMPPIGKTIFYFRQKGKKVKEE